MSDEASDPTSGAWTAEAGGQQQGGMWEEGTAPPGCLLGSLADSGQDRLRWFIFPHNLPADT